ASESPPLVERSKQYHEGISTGACSAETTDLNRLLHERLGSGAQWYVGQRPLGTILDISAHQCAGIKSHSFSSELLPTSPGRLSHPSEDRQRGSSIIHKQTGGTDIPSTLQDGSQSSHLGTTSYPLTEGSASSRIAESSSRYAFKRGSLARRVVSPPRCGEDHLGSFWEGRRRSFRLLGVNSLPSLFLTREETGTSGVR
ncbi:hypothetical protein M9458_041568, partial [Cirrhinus mrigala]